MKLIRFTRDVVIDGDTKCLKDKKYIISDGFLQQIENGFGDNAIASIEHFRAIPAKQYHGQDLTNKSLLVWRTGGMGDLCFITPNLQHIKDTYANSKIYLGCGSKFKSSMLGNPHIDKLLSLPIPYDLLLESDYYLMFEGIIENNPEARNVNAYDLFIRAFGFEGKISNENKLPVLALSQSHLERNREIIAKVGCIRGPNGDTNLIAVGLKASHIIRSIPPMHLNTIVERLVGSDNRVILVGGPDDKDVANSLPISRHPMVIHGYAQALDYRDSIAQIFLSDGVIGPDSSVVHIAGALRKPVVGVFGPFPSRLRMMYYKYASAFDINIRCGPCFMHGIETCEYSDINTKEPLCMMSHSPEVIVNEILALIVAAKKENENNEETQGNNN